MRRSLMLALLSACSGEIYDRAFSARSAESDFGVGTGAGIGGGQWERRRRARAARWTGPDASER